MYYYGAHFYDPSLGRFLVPDSIVPDPNNLQSLNRYMYVRGNPIIYTDPTGHEDEGGYREQGWEELDQSLNEESGWFGPSYSTSYRDLDEDGIADYRMSEIIDGESVRTSYFADGPAKIYDVTLSFGIGGAVGQTPKFFKGVGNWFSGLFKRGPVGSRTASVSELSDFTKSIARLKNRKIIERLESGEDLVLGPGQASRKRMAEIAAATGREVALLRTREGQRILRMGDEGSVPMKGARRLIAHTHPKGILRFSRADRLVLRVLRQRSSVLIGPSGQSVRVHR